MWLPNISSMEMVLTHFGSWTIFENVVEVFHFISREQMCIGINIDRNVYFPTRQRTEESM